MPPGESLEILLVEDDAELATLLARRLVREGYGVQVARDGQAGLHQGLTGHYDLMVVDRALPAIEGLDLVRRLRSRGVQTPVLVLTARGTVEDRIEGLDAGAEDYLVKPFVLGELLARLRALSRRRGLVDPPVDLGRSVLLLEERRVQGPEREPVVLSQREAALLALLARNPKRVFGRRELLAEIFDTADAPNSVDTYVHYLRRKLGPEVVRTVRGAGYRMGSA